MLILKGVTTIEYLADSRLSKSRGSLTFSPLQSWRENLYLRFGTINLLTILLPFIDKSPSITGLEWAFVGIGDDTEALV